MHLDEEQLCCPAQTPEHWFQGTERNWAKQRIWRFPELDCEDHGVL
jgi:hypothetical protein